MSAGGLSQHLTALRDAGIAGRLARLSEVEWRRAASGVDHAHDCSPIPWARALRVTGRGPSPARTSAKTAMSQASAPATPAACGTRRDRPGPTPIRAAAAPVPRR
ncbi:MULTISPECIES: hypothetical protein [unclassified Streptomyces]|uniref:hypothetical protein n=1 Tax=unclassified Streptomyces TaxID=2593676 RepID=UPI0032D5703E